MPVDKGAALLKGRKHAQQRFSQPLDAWKLRVLGRAGLAVKRWAERLTTLVGKAPSHCLDEELDPRAVGASDRG